MSEPVSAPRAESPSERALAAALWGATAFAAAYLLQGALHLPGLIYDPQMRRFLIDTAPSGAQMRYYSDLSGALLAALGAAALRFRWKSLRSDLTVLTGAALSLVALDLAWFFSRVLSALRS